MQKGSVQLRDAYRVRIMIHACILAAACDRRMCGIPPRPPGVYSARLFSSLRRGSRLLYRRLDHLEFMLPSRTCGMFLNA
jgi:hypothetical protein